jgi:hypothetical protein
MESLYPTHPWRVFTTYQLRSDISQMLQSLVIFTDTVQRKHIDYMSLIAARQGLRRREQKAISPVRCLGLRCKRQLR